MDVVLEDMLNRLGVKGDIKCKKINDEYYIKPGVVSKILCVAEQTLRNYHATGELVPEIVYDSGHRLYSLKQVVNYYERQEKKGCDIK